MDEATLALAGHISNRLAEGVGTAIGEGFGNSAAAAAAAAADAVTDARTIVGSLSLGYKILSGITVGSFILLPWLHNGAPVPIYGPLLKGSFVYQIGPNIPPSMILGLPDTICMSPAKYRPRGVLSPVSGPNIPPSIIFGFPDSLCGCPSGLSYMPPVLQPPVENCMYQSIGIGTDASNTTTYGQGPPLINQGNGAASNTAVPASAAILLSTVAIAAGCYFLGNQFKGTDWRQYSPKKIWKVQQELRELRELLKTKDVLIAFGQQQLEEAKIARITEFAELEDRKHAEIAKFRKSHVSRLKELEDQKEREMEREIAIAVRQGSEALRDYGLEMKKLITKKDDEWIEQVKRAHAAEDNYNTFEQEAKEMTLKLRAKLAAAQKSAKESKSAQQEAVAAEKASKKAADQLHQSNLSSKEQIEALKKDIMTTTRQAEDAETRIKAL